MSPIGMKNTRCGEWYNLPQSRERERERRRYACTRET